MRIVLASNNQHKLKELNALLPTSLELIFQRELGIEAVEETGLTFVENAILKARHASRLCKLPAIADDSGLEVDYLNGSPGIRSARYAGETATDMQNNVKLLEALDKLASSQRKARFQSVIVFLRHDEDPTPVIACGTWEGEILDQPQGSGGFGYDPLFYIPSLGRTAAQLPEEEKNRVSHRRLALAKLQEMMNLDV